MNSFLFHSFRNLAYAEGLERQTEAFEALLKAKKTGEQGVNQLFFCEHQPVITLGMHGQVANLLVPEALLAARGVAFYRTNRGGDITFHGPGQITGYPIFDLEGYGLGLKAYIDRLESVIIAFLALYGLKGERLAGATGVWLEASSAQPRKICAIGVKASRYVTMHGFALNINTDLTYFSLMNPCGFKDKGVTSLATELGAPQDYELASARLLELFKAYFK